MSKSGGLLGGIKKLKIDDQDLSTPSRTLSSFTHHYQAQHSHKVKSSTVLYTDITLGEECIACGTSSGEIFLQDVNYLGRTIATKKSHHEGLSSLRRTNPQLLFTCSNSEGNVHLWDFRKHSTTPAQSFTTPEARPLLCLDISSGDKVLSAGSELVGEDSFILFWDCRAAGGGRSGDILGAYWESHSDDVTSLAFHPDKYSTLSSSSTDGLINIFDLMEAREEDALTTSYNTESSVDKIRWDEKGEKIIGITHTNEVQIWGLSSGDKLQAFGREQIAKAMMRTNPEAVFINGIFFIKGRAGLLTSSLKGSCTRYIEVGAEFLEPSATFIDSSAIIQTAQYVGGRWITFDEGGLVRWWAEAESEPENKPHPHTTQATVETVPKKKRKS